MLRKRLCTAKFFSTQILNYYIDKGKTHMKPVISTIDALYGKTAAKQKERYTNLLAQYKSYYASEGNEVVFFSAPGRTEIGGNHTDHNHGKVLAAAVDLDIIAAAEIIDAPKIVLKSVGGAECGIWLDKEDSFSPHADEIGKTAGLIRGIAAGFKAKGYKLGGFKAYVTSAVPVGSGLSSSAAYEVLVGTILNHLFNNGRIDPLVLARIGQSAENKFFGKPCGLMDQCGCAHGGFVYLDFKDGGCVAENIAMDLESFDYALCVADTKGSHADLAEEYAAIPEDMKKIAGFFGAETLREIGIKDLRINLEELRRLYGDRAVLRALHFFNENDRVDRMVYALKNERFDSFLNCVADSGNSSFKYLQNIYPSGEIQAQSVAMGLCVAETSLRGRGVVRVHGGGFAGTIQAYVPMDSLKTFRVDIESVFGVGSCKVLHIRKIGGCRVVV
jgi:galactokinase